eukprot:scaffold77576_cov19-Tisochrysis_lutea.AAC.2
MSTPFPHHDTSDACNLAMLDAPSHSAMLARPHTLPRTESCTSGAASSSHPCKILRLCGAHGVGKTTLVNDLKEALPHMAVEVLGDGEVARSLMRQHEIT